MAFTDHDSAIDDTFEVNVCPASLSCAPGVASSYGGARAGHWRARSGVVSAIDDTCPTVCNEDYRAGGGHGEEDEPIRAIGGDLLKRLELATIEEERKNFIVQEIAAGSLHTATTSEKSKESKTRRFYAPAYIRGREPEQSAKLTKQEKRPPVVKTKEEKKQRIDTVPAAPASTTHSKGQGVRITSKDGREAVVTLPNQAYVTSASPTAPISSSHRRHNEENEQTQASGAAHDNARSVEAEPTANIFKEQVKPMNVGQPQAKKNKTKTKTKKQEQLVPKQNPSIKLAQGSQNGWDATVIVESRKGSLKDSGIGFGNFFDDIPVPKVPSAAPSAAVRANSLISAVRSISENSRTKGHRPAASVSNEDADVRRTSQWPAGSMFRDHFSAAPSDAVLGEIRETLANMSQHSGKSDTGWHAPSARVGSWRDRKSGGWGSTKTSMSGALTRQDFRAAVKSISAHSRGFGNEEESPYNSRKSSSHVKHSHTLYSGLWSGERSRAVSAERLWDGVTRDIRDRKNRVQELDIASDHFGTGGLGVLDFDRASTLKPWDTSQSGAVSMQSIRGRIRTISEYSRRSAGDRAGTSVRSCDRRQVQELDTRHTGSTGVEEHEDVVKSAVSWNSRAYETVRSEDTAANGSGKAAQPFYDGFRVVGEGVINARFDPRQNSVEGIQGRGEGWVCPRSEGDVEGKQHSSEPPRRHFYSHLSSSDVAASERIPPKSTIFAGAGWIEGHPLSVAPSSCRTPVQSHIRLPEGAYRKLPVHHRGKKNLSFEEWQEVQQSTFQAEGTVIGSIRSERAPPSAASDSVYSAIRQYTKENKPPSVVRSFAPISRKSGQSGDWSEMHGEVHLHMPWDRS
ncbi:hypothetical protein LTR86_003724 [Recurvomyces mirabilis]|nr:hypothetical protein LTR86_003724 [Recurvomyces mirabilis]